MSEAALTVEIVSPQGNVYSNSNVAFVSAPATLGRVGILPFHMPFFSTLESGEVRVEEKNGEMINITIQPGFLQIQENHVEILVEEAKPAV